MVSRVVNLVSDGISRVKRLSGGIVRSKNYLVCNKVSGGILCSNKGISWYLVCKKKYLAVSCE